ncbi:MAG: hypothetical protein JWR58_5643 [Pseudonocardia sp.]|nr:hypothetical protein [Pseudonocardia sp.]
MLSLEQTVVEFEHNVASAVIDELERNRERIEQSSRPPPGGGWRVA